MFTHMPSHASFSCAGIRWQIKSQVFQEEELVVEGFQVEEEKVEETTQIG